MKCGKCNTDMYIDETQTQADRETFVYKCPNPACLSYGYREWAQAKRAEAQGEKGGTGSTSV